MYILISLFCVIFLFLCLSQLIRSFLLNFTYVLVTSFIYLHNYLSHLSSRGPLYIRNHRTTCFVMLNYHLLRGFYKRTINVSMITIKNGLQITLLINMYCNNSQETTILKIAYVKCEIFLLYIMKSGELVPYHHYGPITIGRNVTMPFVLARSGNFLRASSAESIFNI